MKSNKKYSVVSDFDGLYSNIQPYCPQLFSSINFIDMCGGNKPCFSMHPDMLSALGLWVKCCTTSVS